LEEPATSIFGVEDGDYENCRNMYLLNFGKYLPDYMASTNTLVRILTRASDILTEVFL
jgi:hypothetical protein